MKVLGFKCKAESARMKMWEWKCEDENMGMKNTGDEGIKRWKIWGWKYRGWKCKDETAGMKCHTATDSYIRFIKELQTLLDALFLKNFWLENFEFTCRILAALFYSNIFKV